MPESSAAVDARSSSRRPRRRLWRRAILIALLAIWAGTAYWQTHKTLPPGTHVASTVHSVPATDVTFIADVTTADAYGRPIISQAIFDQVLEIVRKARRFLVLDYFLFNAQRGASGTDDVVRPLSGELREALLEQKRRNPDLRVLFITDPINDVYGGDPSEDLERLREAGIDVAVTDLDRLRDSNFAYSSLWRLALRWWSGDDGNPEGRREEMSTRWLPNPLDEASQRVPFGAWARLVNFKANHRKVVIGDDGAGRLVGIVTSANPHDASSGHSNVGAKIRGRVLVPLLESEMAIARFSGWEGVIAVDTELPAVPADPRDFESGRVVRAQMLTEGAIRGATIERIRSAIRGESIDIAMFYISDRHVIDALLAASRRGVKVRLILDPNKDAFGREKSGLPNRPVASELVAASDGAIHVRWYRTHGEQFHTKLVMVYGAERFWMTLGSANLTRRNIGDYNLEANVGIEAVRSSALARQVIEYFNVLWGNRAPLGIEYTADYGVYADPSQGHYWLYRIMEGMGLSTF